MRALVTVLREIYHSGTFEVIGDTREEIEAKAKALAPDMVLKNKHTTEYKILRVDEIIPPEGGPKCLKFVTILIHALPIKRSAS